MATRKLGGNGHNNNMFVILIVVMVSHVCVYICQISNCVLYIHIGSLLHVNSVNINSIMLFKNLLLSIQIEGL